MKAKRALCMLAAILLVVAMMLMFLTGCNRQVIDTTFSYDNAILVLPDGGIEALIRRYEMEQGDDVWLCTYKLKEIGCDLEKWEKERGDQ